MERNLQTLQADCDAAGVRLRPHGKMAKCSRLAQRQLDLGAVGLCCQTVGEAEAFADAGIIDLLVSAPVPPWGWPALARLVARGVRVSAVIDSRAQLQLAPKGVRLLVDVDGGQQRSGVPFAQAPALVREILRSGHEWGGIQCYLGHLQADRDRAEAHAVACDRLKALLAELARENLVPDVVTGGGTGTAPLDLASGVFTELQAGSYAFMDRIYADAGAGFEPALFVAATVVSLHHKHHISVDCGLKSVAVEALPRFVSGVPDGTTFRFQGDEHGAAVHMGEVEWPAEGSFVWLQPGHVDPTVNLYDALWVADEDGKLERWAIDARRVTPAT